jgi:hypothetical protein
VDENGVLRTTLISPCIHPTAHLVTLKGCKVINDLDMTTHGALGAHLQGAAVTIGKFSDEHRFPSGNWHRATTTEIRPDWTIFGQR